MSYSTKSIIEALTRTHGMIYLAAKELGCAPKTIYRRAEKEEKIRDAIEEYRGQIIDKAELKLETAVMNGEPWAITLALKTIGKNRGYVEKQELSHEGEVKIQVEYADDPYQIRQTTPGATEGDSEPEAV